MTYAGSPALGAWLEECIDEAIEDMRSEQYEEEFRSFPPEQSDDGAFYASFAEKTGLENPAIYLLPEPKGPLDGLFGQPSVGDPNGEFIGAPRRETAGAFGVAQRLKSAGVLELLDPWKQRSIEQSLQMLEGTKDGAVMLIGAPVGVRMD